MGGEILSRDLWCHDFGFRSGREARKAAFSAGVSTLALVWRETRGDGLAKAPGGGEPFRSDNRLVGGFIRRSPLQARLDSRGPRLHGRIPPERDAPIWAAPSQPWGGDAAAPGVLDSRNDR